MKRFVIVVDEAPVEQRNAFTESLRPQSPTVGFWHWIETAWVIADSRPGVTVSTWREAAREHLPTATLIAFEIVAGQWAGFAPKASHKWLEDHLVDRHG